MSSEVAELDREVEDLPDGWTLSTVGETADILDRLRVPLNSGERRERQGPYPYWGANGVLDHIDDYIFDEPLVLMAEDGGYFDEAATRPICQRLDGPAWVNNHAHIIRPTGADRDYFYFWFVHRDITPFIKGGTRSKLNQADLKRLPIWLPPLDEQRRIAEVMRSGDEAIAANGDAVEQLRVTRDAIRDEHFGASGIQSCTRTLGSVCDITKLAGFEYSKHIRYGEGDEIIAVRGLNMKDGALSLDDVKTISRATSQALPRSALRKGDLVMSYVGTIGEVAMIDADDRYHLAPNVALLRCGEQALPEYILHFLYSCAGREQINKHVSTSSQRSLSMGKIRSFEIELPSVDHQRFIAETMYTLNASLTKGVQTQNQLLAHKAHLLKNLLSGHVRVPA